MSTWYLPGESGKLGPSPISHMASRDHSQLSQSEIAIFADTCLPPQSTWNHMDVPLRSQACHSHELSAEVWPLISIPSASEFAFTPASVFRSAACLWV